MADISTIRYRGTNRYGTGTTGRMAVHDLAAWVERLYQQGWKSLTVTDDSGTEVAGISKPGRKRIWWAESAIAEGE